MENFATSFDQSACKISAVENQDGKPAEHLASQVWSEMQELGGKISSNLKSITDSPTFRRILDSLPPQKEDVAPKQADWTVAIDFTTDFGDGQGVDSGLQNLKDFAAKTKGKNITIVAQAAIADTDEFDMFGPVVTKDTKYRLDRYVIKDGEMKQVSSADSKGYAEDVKELLEYSGKNHPSKRCALIMDSHGTGNEGLLGDSGKATTDEFVKAVQDGLKASGHEKLDMLDFDVCLMAQNGAISKICKIADQVVASAETESIYNGQNYLDPIRRIADKPEADGLTLARDIVVQTHKDMQDWKLDGWEPSVHTLAHLNLRKYNEFRKSLDQLGDQLVTAIKNPNNRKAIEDAIDHSQKYGSSGSLLSQLFGGNKLAGRHRTDLKEFTERVLTSIDNGDIQDPDRNLKKAAQELMNKRSLLVDSYHGEAEYEKAGGLSVFLPGKNLRNTEKEAAQHTAAGRLSELTDDKHFADCNKSDKSREEFVKKVKDEVFWTRPHFYIFGTPGVDKELDKIDKAIEGFSKAKDDAQRKESFKELHHASLELANTNEFKAQYKQQLESLNEKVSKVYKVNFIDDSNGWSRFRLKLRDSK